MNRTRPAVAIARASLYLIVGLLAFGGGGGSCNDPLQRGPYLQLGTDSSIVVRWRTKNPASSRVAYGTSVGNLDQSVEDGTLVTEHEVTLAGLTADTTYFYSIGSTTEVLAGGDVDHTFTTAPTTGTAQPTRIWVIGDSGTGNADAENVRDAYLAYTGSSPTDVWLMLGDNAYWSGLDNEYQKKVFDIYPSFLRTTPVWPTLGNHDGYTADSANPVRALLRDLHPPHRGGGRRPALRHRGLLLLRPREHPLRLPRVLRDGPLGRRPDAHVARRRSRRQHPGLGRSPSGTTRPTRRAPTTPTTSCSSSRCGRTPCRSSRTTGSISSCPGHSHSYERSFLLDGHYGTSGTLTGAMIIDGGDGSESGDGSYAKSATGPVPHEGAVYAVAGSSGLTSNGSLDHPVMVVSVKELGSMVIDVDGGRLDALFLDDAGATLDEFTIVKGP